MSNAVRPNKIGIHNLVFTDVWDEPRARQAIDTAARIGFDVIEVLLFDPANIADRSTFSDPHHYSEGVRYVVVNGTVVVGTRARTVHRHPGGHLAHRGDADGDPVGARGVAADEIQAVAIRQREEALREGAEPRLVGHRKRQRQRGPPRRGAHGGEIGKVHGERLVAERTRVRPRQSGAVRTPAQVARANTARDWARSWAGQAWCRAAGCAHKDLRLPGSGAGLLQAGWRRLPLRLVQLPQAG